MAKWTLRVRGTNRGRKISCLIGCATRRSCRELAARARREGVWRMGRARNGHKRVVTDLPAAGIENVEYFLTRRGRP